MRRITSGVASTGHHDPEPQASTPSSSSWFPRLGNLLGCLQTRRSSAPPAPRTTTLVDQAPRTAVATDQHASNCLALVPRTTTLADQAPRTALATGEHASNCLALVQNARQLFENLLGGGQVPTPEDARLCVPVLGLLSRREQSTLVQVLTSPAAHPIYNWTALDNPFAEFVPHLAELDKSVRAELVERAIRREGMNAATAVGSLGGGLAHLDARLIDRLVDKATGLGDERWRAFAIRDLSAGWRHMNPGQQRRLWQAAKKLEVHHFRAIQGLAAQLKHMQPKEQAFLFEGATRLRDPFEKAIALSGLAASMEVLDKRQRATLKGVLDLGHVPVAMSKVVYAFASAVEHLTPDERKQLVDVIKKLESPCHAMAALGPHLEHITPEQQGQLLTAAAGWWAPERIIAVRGFAAGLPHMEPDGHRQMVDLALGMGSADYTAEAIGAMGPHLKHLGDDLRDAVVSRALLLLERDQISLEGLRLLTAGLGAGMEALREEQRTALVARAVDAQARGARAQSPSIAAAIAGLALGQQHLSEASFAKLVKAAASLKMDLHVAVASCKLFPLAAQGSAQPQSFPGLSSRARLSTLAVET